MCPEDSRVEDTTSLFTLQLGTVLNMVSFWRKNTSFRVFLIIPSEWTSDLLLEQKQKVQETLASIRINAKIETVPFVQPNAMSSGASSLPDGEPQQSTSLTNSTSSPPLRHSSTSSGQDTSVNLEKITGRYLSSVNKIMRNYR